MQNGRVDIGLPARIIAAQFDLHTCHREASGQAVGQEVFHRVARAARQDAYVGLSASDEDDGQIGRSLDRIGHGGNHSHHAILTGHQHVDHAVLNLFGHNGSGHVNFFHLQADALLDGCVFGSDLCFVLADVVVQTVHIFGVEQHHGMSLARDGVAHVAAFERSQLAIELKQQVVNDAHQQLVGIAAAFVYFEARVSAAQSFQRQLACYEAFSGCFFLILKRSGEVDTAGATDVQFAFFLGVEVQQDVALQGSGFQPESTYHARFLVFGDEHFQRSVLQVGGFEHSHGGCHAQTVVGTKGCSFSLHPVAVDAGFNRVFRKIVYRIIVFLGYHVHVGLQDDAPAVLHARRGRLADDDVAYFIDKGLQPQPLTEIDQKFGHLFYMSGRTGDLSQRIEMLPHVLWSKL